MEVRLGKSCRLKTKGQNLIKSVGVKNRALRPCSNEIKLFTCLNYLKLIPFNSS
jgi:hypothetical protein